MAENTAIEWCDHTWSPVWGCTEVSKAETGGGGCDNCYARTLAHRFGYGWNGAPMREFGDHHWNEPLRWNRRAAEHGKQPRVFPSMCDPFDKDWPPGVRERFLELIALTPNLTWLLLTKRIGNVARMVPAEWLWPDGWPRNVWLGATMVNQPEYDRDIGKLLRIPARVHFLSIEPMLGPIDMRIGGASMPDHAEHRPLAQLDWVICGGESGPGARPMHPDWARSLRDQCAAAGVPFMFKQNGEWADAKTAGVVQSGPVLGKHGDVPDWMHQEVLLFPGSAMRVRAHSWTGHATDLMFRVGKKAAGRLLDGVEHNGFPDGGQHA